MSKMARRCRRSWYYASNIMRSLMPNWCFRRRLASLLAEAADRPDVQQRVDYYLKHDQPFTVGPCARSIASLRPDGMTTYFFDMRNVARYFSGDLRLSYRFGDITAVPEVPAFVKSRPIDGDNCNAVLMKLNQIRHFVFVRDRRRFVDKQEAAVWRGKSMGKPARQDFVSRFRESSLCDVGLIDARLAGQPGHRPFMSIANRLAYRYIVSIEGNDVATNLKWIMSSSSLCCMARPRFETWFMEGSLVPDQHYVLLLDDYSDLEEKVAWYNRHPAAAQAIITQANTYVDQFRDRHRERLIALAVLERYFRLSGQL